jgi:TRAP-type C4-dicarboxylate transport system permease small subunit
VKRLTKIVATYDFIINLAAVLAGALLAVMVLSVAVGVFMRYFMKSALPWVMELNEYSLLYVTFLGTAWVLRRKKHVNIDLLVNRLNPRHRIVLKTVTSLCSAIICLVVIWYGGKIVWGYFESGRHAATGLELPLAYVLVIIPVGSFLLFLGLLREIYNYLCSREVVSDTERRIN